MVCTGKGEECPECGQLGTTVFAFLNVGTYY